MHLQIKSNDPYSESFDWQNDGNNQIKLCKSNKPSPSNNQSQKKMILSSNNEKWISRRDEAKHKTHEKREFSQQQRNSIQKSSHANN